MIEKKKRLRKGGISIFACFGVLLMGMTTFIAACGGGENAAGASAVVNEGTAVFSIDWYLNGYSEETFSLTPSQFESTRCSHAGVVKILCNVYQPPETLVWQSDPWQCSDIHLTVDHIPAGSNFKLVCFGMDKHDEIVQAGKMATLKIKAGQTTDAGVLESFPFVARLTTPTNRTTVPAAPLTLSWSSVPNACRYRVQISKTPEFTRPVVDDATTCASYTSDKLLSESTYFWRVFAVDRYGIQGCASETWEFATQPGSACRAPSLSPIGNQTVAEGQAIAFFITAVDPDEKDQLIFKADPLPVNAAFESGATSGVFTWNTVIGDMGNHPIRFTVCDACASGPLCDSEEIIISVGNVCRPPVLNPIGDRYETIFNPLEFSIAAKDPDGEATLTYIATTVAAEVEENAAIAENRFFPETQMFKWLSPMWDDVGRYRINFKVCDDCSDGPLCDEEEISLTIAPPPPEYYYGHWRDNDLAAHWVEAIRVTPKRGGADPRAPLVFDLSADRSFPDAPHPITVDSVETIPLVLQYHYDWADITLKIFPLSATSLKIHEEIDFTEADGRKDIESTYFPQRES